MTEIQTNFRSNPSKCAFNNYGFCKFKLECRKQHAQNVCENQNCDKKCVNRHPKSCRNKDKCKFLKLNTCAFNHEALEKVNDEVCGQAKIDSDGIGELKRLVSENKEHFESRITSLTDAVNNERKKTENQENALKDALKINIDLEKIFKNEIKDLNLKITKVECSNKDLKSKVEDRQTKLEELKDVVKEMLTKENIFETKLKYLENKQKNEIEELKEKICIIKTKTEKPVNTRKEDAIEESSNIVFKELKGRNVTIVKATTENNPPKIVTSSKDEENEVKKNSETVKPKPKRTKITKKVFEERLIIAYVWDAELMLKDFDNSELVSNNQECKKCEFYTHSEGMLRRHKVLIHDSGKETNQNIIIGFEADVQRHYKVLESKGKSLENFKCDECDYKIYSSGKLTLHKLTNHQG